MAPRQGPAPAGALIRAGSYFSDGHVRAFGADRHFARVLDLVHAEAVVSERWRTVAAVATAPSCVAVLGMALAAGHEVAQAALADALPPGGLLDLTATQLGQWPESRPCATAEVTPICR
jgi:hypothetical protein